MRKNLFLVLALFSVLCISAKADVTPEQLTDPEYLINGGYSAVTAEEVLISKNRANGKPCETLYEEEHKNVFVRAWRKFYGYMDPAQDTERIYHDIKMRPSATDL